MLLEIGIQPSKVFLWDTRILEFFLLAKKILLNV